MRRYSGRRRRFSTSRAAWGWPEERRRAAAPRRPEVPSLVGSSIEGARERMDDIFFVLSSQRENRNQRQFGSTDRHKRKKKPAQKKLFAMPTSAERIRAILLIREISCVTQIPGFWPDTRVQERVVIGWAGVIGNGFLSTGPALLWLTVRGWGGWSPATKAYCSLRLATS